MRSRESARKPRPVAHKYWRTPNLTLALPAQLSPPRTSLTTHLLLRPNPFSSISSIMKSSVLTSINPSGRDRLSNFFSKLIDGDFDLAQEYFPSPTQSPIATTPETSPRSSLSSDDSTMPPTPEPRRRALSAIDNDPTVAREHDLTFSRPIHPFESLEELQRLAADEIAESRRKFQPLPADLRPRKMSLPTIEDVHTPPRSPKKPRVAAQVAGREAAKDDALEAVGLCDDLFVRATPQKTRGVPQTPRVQKEVAPVIEESDNESDGVVYTDSDEEDAPFYFNPPAVINEALVLSFMREMHERAYGFTGQRYFPVTEALSVCLDPIPPPPVSMTREELMESVAEYREAHRPMKRRLSDESRD